VRGGVKFSKLTIHDKISALSEIYLPKNIVLEGDKNIVLEGDKNIVSHFVKSRGEL
jgi:hypothetical protein